MYISSDCHNPVLSFPRILHLKFWAIVTSTPLSRPGCDIPSLKSGARASNSSAALYGTKVSTHVFHAVSEPYENSCGNVHCIVRVRV